MITVTTLASGALLFALTGQSTQDTPDPLDPAHMEAPEQAPEEQPDPVPEPEEEEDGMTDEVVTDFTDAEITAFASAAMEIRAMQEDTVQDEAARDETVMRAEAEAIVARHGLDPDTYNAIGNAAQRDPAVATRVQEAVAQMGNAVAR